MYLCIYKCAPSHGRAVRGLCGINPPWKTTSSENNDNCVSGRLEHHPQASDQNILCDSCSIIIVLFRHFVSANGESMNASSSIRDIARKIMKWLQ